MENHLDLLSKISQVPTPEGAWGRTLKKLKDSKPEIVPLRWLVSAAAGIALFFAIDLYLVTMSGSSELEPDAYEIDYSLYND